jgi:hypothetical protein
MTEEEREKIITGLATSPDFLGALQSCLGRWAQVKDEEISAVDISLYMFCEGYFSCMHYMEVKEKLLPYKHVSISTGSIIEY